MEMYMINETISSKKLDATFRRRWQHGSFYLSTKVHKINLSRIRPYNISPRLEGPH